MLDREKMIANLSGNNNFKVLISEAVNELSIEFLNDFSNLLRKSRSINKYPDLIYLTFWCSKKKIQDYLKDFNSKEIRLGRGLIFHICPANVPTNFMYSFIYGLLSGNSNVIKIPSKDSKEKDIIISTLKQILNKKKYLKLKRSNCFIKYNNDTEITKNISSVCDGRVIWGGDQTINQVRKFWIPERAIELTFSDRYSLSIINLNALKKSTNKELAILAKNFFKDTYNMNQSACNSPHFIFWVGRPDEKLKNNFWNLLNKTVKENFLFDHIHVIDKYSNLIENIVKNEKFNKINMFKNNLYVLDPNANTKKISDIRGTNGTFFQKNIRQIDDLKNFINKKCQTVAYFGFSQNELKSFILKNNLFGIDRIVPIGKALEIDIVWDGYEVVKNLSRVIIVN